MLPQKEAVAEYRLEKRDGGFAVYRCEPATCRVTCSDGADGLVVAPSVPVRQVIKGYVEQPAFFAYYKKDDIWFTDSEAGFQRYVQDRTTREVRAALRKCGFSPVEIRDVIKTAKKGQP